MGKMASADYLFNSEPENLAGADRERQNSNGEDQIGVISSEPES